MINLENLFKTQKLLDDRIMDEHKLHGQDLLPKKILALQVELGELANEWRGFKFWSRDQEPRTKKYSSDYLVLPDGTEIEKESNPLLEEYVDCLHFILSIGNDLKIDIKEWSIDRFLNKTILGQFSQTYYVISDLQFEPNKIDLVIVLEHFLALGEMLGFTTDQIEQAYYQKNKINHQRQTDKY